ncbi:MAG: type IV secretion system DNA-binding domain-containing protein [Devosia sp.]
MSHERVLILGRTNARSDRRVFGLRQDDRLSHVYLIGKTGTGKSTLLEQMLRQDIAAGRGVALIDPHGDLVERVAHWARPVRDDLLYLDLADPNLSLGYNPLLHVRAELRSLVASGALDLFKLLWSEAWGVRMEHILRNALLALLEQPKATLADILPLLSDKAFRSKLVTKVENQQVKTFWLKEFPNYSFRYQADGIAPIQNKVGAFLSDPRLRKFLTPDDGGLRLRTIMDEGRVLLVNLAQGKLGADSSHLLGGLLVTALGSAAFSRAFDEEGTRRPFFVYVDEFQTFTTLAVANMLAELRKYGVGMVLAHQYLSQLDPQVRDAVLGNAGTLIAFRLGSADAAVLAKEFAPVIDAHDFLSLSNHTAYLRLLVNGEPTRPFSATTVVDEQGAGH